VPEEVIASVLAHHARRSEGPASTPAGGVSVPVYRPETLNVLFGESAS
jgi:hypothetical protein